MMAEMSGKETDRWPGMGALPIPAIIIVRTYYPRISVCTSAVSGSTTGFAAGVG